MSKQIRYGAGDKDKVRVASVTQQQIVELAAHLDLTQAGVMQEAVCRLYMQEVYGEQQKALADLQAKYDATHSQNSCS